MIERPRYLSKLISKKQNGLIKIITGNRRCGKSYLLFNIYHEYLNSIGVQDSQIIQLALDETANARYRNPVELDKYIREVTKDTLKIYYVFLDEIQKVEDIQNPFVPNSDSKISFVDTVIGLMKLKNVDLYITGSNSKMLSSDILTEFRGRSDEIRVHPLSFAEYYSAVGGDKSEAFDDYSFYGGMPLIISRPDDGAKMNYLKSLFSEVYIKDIAERKRIERQDVLEMIIDLLCSSIGSLTNPNKIADTLLIFTKHQVKQFKRNLRTIRINKSRNRT